jgi:alpha-L-fucosidase 2
MGRATEHRSAPVQPVLSVVEASHSCTIGTFFVIARNEVICFITKPYFWFKNITALHLTPYALCLLFSLFTIHHSLSAQQDLQLWYNQPAQKWTDALPIGNGNLGAMIYGGINEEHLQFNESTLWSGKPREYARKDAYKYLQPIRNLLNQGKQKEAEALAGKEFMGVKDVDDSVYAIPKKAWFARVSAEYKYAAIDFDDSKWLTMQLPTSNGWEQLKGLDGLDGAVWFRTSFNLPKEMLGKDLVIDLGRIRDVDLTYINGNFIGSTEGISTKRSYTIKAQFLNEGKNIIAIQVVNFFDKGGFTGIKENRKIFVVYPKGESANNGIELSTTWKYFNHDNNPPQFPQYQASYQPFGDLFFTFTNQSNSINYKRELDISNAISTVSYTSNNINYRREYLASNPANLIAANFTANKKGSINLVAYFSSVHSNYVLKKINNKTIGLYVQVKNGALNGVAYLFVDAVNGVVNIDKNSIALQHCDEATFYLIAATNFVNYKDVSANATERCNAILQKIKAKKYAEIKAAHIADYQKLFNTFSINFNKSSKQNIPTEKRIKQFNSKDDNALLALYMQFSRYLLIASSRSNSKQPANLQGLWNNLLTPPWGSKYTTNINLEMNYWGADLFNLSSCANPLINKVNELSIVGKQTAKEHYNANGWVLHHNTDLWNGTAPINASNHGVWVTGSAWLSNMIWEHYLFTQDKNFLQKNYSAMKTAAQFYQDFLVKDNETGWLISTPSNSPENGGLVAGPTMDHQIIRELFLNTIAASKALQTDESLRQSLLEKIKQIAPNQIGKHGQLQEWLKDIDDTTNKHRHVSHLWGVYPGNDITWKDSAMMKAAKQSLLYRGDDGTGWSLAWKTNLWARFKEGNHALLMAEKLLSFADDDGSTSEKGGVYKNMFDAHPPFQIDGNFGGSAGIAEMLVQSHTKYIELLPALPDALETGSIKGLCARGRFEINMQWNNGKLQSVSVLSKSGNDCWLQYGNKQIQFKTEKGKTYKFNNELQKL